LANPLSSRACSSGDHRSASPAPPVTTARLAPGRGAARPPCSPLRPAAVAARAPARGCGGVTRQGTPRGRRSPPSHSLQMPPARMSRGVSYGIPRGRRRIHCSEERLASVRTAMAARFGNGRRRVRDGRRLDFLFGNSLLKYDGRSFCEEKYDG
jgi:hypothetical protein